MSFFLFKKKQTGVHPPRHGRGQGEYHGEPRRGMRERSGIWEDAEEVRE